MYAEGANRWIIIIWDSNDSRLTDSDTTGDVSFAMLELRKIVIDGVWKKNREDAGIFHLRPTPNVEERFTPLMCAKGSECVYSISADRYVCFARCIFCTHHSSSACKLSSSPPATITALYNHDNFNNLPSLKFLINVYWNQKRENLTAVKCRDN